MKTTMITPLPSRAYRLLLVAGLLASCCSCQGFVTLAGVAANEAAFARLDTQVKTALPTRNTDAVRRDDLLPRQVSPHGRPATQSEVVIPTDTNSERSRFIQPEIDSIAASSAIPSEVTSLPLPPDAPHVPEANIRTHHESATLVEATSAPQVMLLDPVTAPAAETTMTSANTPIRTDAPLEHAAAPIESDPIQTGDEPETLALDLAPLAQLRTGTAQSQPVVTAGAQTVWLNSNDATPSPAQPLPVTAQDETQVTTATTEEPIEIVADGYYSEAQDPASSHCVTDQYLVDAVDQGWEEGCQLLPMDAPLYLADEYLCDGGDRETRARVSRDWRVTGLDLEDTIGHFDTLDGRVVVTPSNSVCIYAPRFAAVRKVVQTSEDGLAVVMQEVDTPEPASTDLAINEAVRVHQPLMPGRDDGLHAARGIDHRVRGLEDLHALRVHELSKDFQAYEDLQVIHTGIHRSTERALLEQWSQAAIQWDETVGPEVILDGDPAITETTVEKSATIHHIGLPGKPKLRVIKLASKRSAKPGEEVMFTLRFDNVGDQTIGNVTIMDNLTTRLEYVPESAECNLDAEFYTDPNQGESLALRWEIKQPLKPGEGGIIRFRCKVR